MIFRFLLIFIFLFCTFWELTSQKVASIKDYAVIISAEVDSLSEKVTLNWISDTNSYKYYIYKKKLTDSTFGEHFAVLNGDVKSFTDDLKNGEIVEYKIERDAWNYWSYGYITAGHSKYISHKTGKVLVLCDDSLYLNLKSSIDLYIDDLICEGWSPKLLLAPRAEEFSYEKVLYTKELINNYYSQNPDLRTIVLVGRVAVPYSGSFAVDGHSPDHDGAWPTDVYYAINSNNWTDTSRNTKSDNLRIQNLPDDGKFDQIIIPDNVKFELGRIDLYNLPAFKETEIELLKSYFQSNHLYRIGSLKTSDSAIVNDFFGKDYKEGFAASGWSNFSTIIGTNNISEELLRYSTRKNSYLLAYGSGPGSFNSVSQTLYTDDIAQEQYNVFFTLLFGSYNGDWDSEDNIMRAVLASKPLGMAVAWSGRPYWFIHHLGLGYNLGYSTKLSQNSKPEIYEATSPYARRFNHIALMGDPTLKLFYFEGTDNVNAVVENNGIKLNWNISKNNDVLGYYIYRSDKVDGEFLLLNETPVKDSMYYDEMPLLGNNIYMVRAAKIQNTASGSFINLSNGTKSNLRFYPDISDDEIVRVFPNPTFNKLTLAISNSFLGNPEIKIYDLNGLKLNQIIPSYINSNIYELNLTDENGSFFPVGVYLLEISINNRKIIKKIIKI
jgi:hypothetical protein